jgi:beta-lactam-binding protein with PASTA domain
MRICQSCGRENPPDQDFCQCGEYLRWDPTGVVQAVTPEVLQQHAAESATPAQEPPAAAPDGAQVTPAAPVTPASPGNGHSEPPAAAAPPPPPAPAAPAPPAPPPAPKTAIQQAVVQEAASATIVLRLPDGDKAIEQTLSVSVEPGQRARALALVRNQSGIVDNYELKVEGLPDEWWSIFPDTVYLVPFGTGGTYEQEVEVHLHPPRSPQAESRIWDLKVVAHSKANNAPAASAPLALGIEPYTETNTKIRPERVKGRRQALFDVAVHNTANAPVLVALEGSDPDGEMDFAFDRPPQQIGPGHSVNVGMRVRPPRQHWVGRPLEHRLQVTTLTGEEAEERLAAEPLPPEVLTQPAPPRRRGLLRRRKVPAAAGGYAPRVYKPQVHPPGMSIGPGGIHLVGGSFKAPRVQAPKVPKKQIKPGDLKLPSRGGAPAMPLMPNQAMFRQKAWIGWWVLPLLLLLAIAAIIIYLLLPRNVTVPKVVGAKTSFDAEKTLTAAGLTLSPDVKQQVSTEQPPGTVLAQTPPAGETAKKGSAVALLVAVGSGTAQVPSIVKLNSAQADQALRAKGLTLGSGSPQPVDPAAKIASQIPAAGQVVKQGTPVNFFFAKPAAPDKAAVKGKDKAAQQQAKKSAAQAAKGGAVPAIAAGTAAAAVAGQVSKNGIVPVTINAFDAAKKGTVFKTDPAAGTKLKAGQKLTLYVSAGFPQLVFDDGHNVINVDGATGKRINQPAHGPQDEIDPTWSPDATQVMYSAGGQLFLKDMTKKNATATPVTSQSDFITNPSWAPTGNANVIAMIGWNKDHSRTALCLSTLTKSGLSPVCKQVPDLNVGHSIHWSNDGKTLLAFGQTPTTGVKQGIVEWKTKKPFSPNINDWSAGKLVTPSDTPGHAVIDAALSPDGKTLALASNINSDFFRLYLTSPGDFKLANAKPTPVRACKVAWRSDSKEIVVIDSGHGCNSDPLQATGALFGVFLPNFDSKALNASGDNPAFQPLTLGG